MNKIVIELCAEDRARLDRIGCLLETLTTQTAPLELRVAEPMFATAAADHPADAPTTHLEPPAASRGSNVPEQASVPPMPPVKPPAPASEAKPISLGEFQKAITQRCVESEEIKKKVKALIESYAASVSAVPEDKRAEVLAALAKL